MMRHAQTERGLRTSLQLILGELLQLFEPERVELAARDTISGAVSMWRLDRKRPDHVQLVQEESAAVETLLSSDLPAVTSHSGRPSSASPSRTVHGGDIQLSGL